ncbi:MAG: hypothetical protein KIT72_13190 [Polyangiaceae bacterium]|nr:hypothetical protein [Polyangiaceae bacterium]MCW5791366.1 hypothetical protein [Polyangiaceae bacterium]
MSQAYLTWCAPRGLPRAAPPLSSRPPIERLPIERPPNHTPIERRAAGLVAASLVVCGLLTSAPAQAQHLQVATSPEPGEVSVSARVSSEPPEEEDPSAAAHERMIGIGPTFAQVSSPDDTQRGGSLVLGQFSSVNVTLHGERGGAFGWAHSGSGFAFLGGGTEELEGGIGLEVETGPMLSLTGSHGLFARTGLSAELMGNDLYYSSWVTLPRLSLGYRFHEDRGALVDLAVFAAPALVGRAKRPLGGGSQRLGGQLEHGAKLILGWEWMRLDVGMQLFSDWEDQLTTSIKAGACGQVGRAVTLCFRGRVLSAMLSPNDASDTQIATFGVFLGIGGVRIRPFSRPPREPHEGGPAWSPDEPTSDAQEPTPVAAP